MLLYFFIVVSRVCGSGKVVLQI